MNEWANRETTHNAHERTEREREEAPGATTPLHKYAQYPTQRGTKDFNDKGNEIFGFTLTCDIYHFPSTHVAVSPSSYQPPSHPFTPNPLVIIYMYAL